MVNGLGVLGWGVGGIEAEAAMLGQPMSMLIPQVVGFRLHGELPEGATATDLVLTVTEMLRERGVVGKFVEFYGAGLAGLPLADRATIGNMSPEFGSTCAIFPIDAETLRYLSSPGARPSRSSWSRPTPRSRACGTTRPRRSRRSRDEIELDLATVEPSLAGPKRPQDRVSLSQSQAVFQQALRDYVPSDGDQADAQDEAIAESYPGVRPAGQRHARPRGCRCERLPAAAAGGSARRRCRTTARRSAVTRRRRDFELDHGHVVIAAITSCTNTSNPSVMVGAGILARNALARGLTSKPWVKTSLAPGSKVVTEYLDRAGLTEPLEQLGFNLVGYGCTTCIGNSGPLPPEISDAVAEHDLAVVSVLSGNRNFEGRINPDVKMNYLASPPLCVAYALAGTMDIDLAARPARPGRRRRGRLPARHLAVRAGDRPDRRRGGAVRHVPQELRRGLRRRRALERRSRCPTATASHWDEQSTYVRQPPFFEDMPRRAAGGPRASSGARVLAVLGDTVTTDHISPAGSIKRDGPAGALPAGARRRARATSTPTARAAATTR